MKKLMFVIVVILWFPASSIAGESKMVMNDFSLADMLNIEIYSAGKKAEKVIEIPASVKIITREEIQLYGYRSILEVLEHISGIYHLNPYTLTHTLGSFGIRGVWTSSGPNGNTAILVNGVNQFEYKDNTNPFSKITVPVEAVDRIEIIKGPMAVMYGSGASQGVINIITNASEKDGGVNLVAGSIGWEQPNPEPSHSMTAKYTDGEGDFNLNINASFSKNSGPDIKFRNMSNEPEQMLMNPMYNIMDMELSTRNRLEHENKYLNLAAVYKDFYADISYNETDQEFYFVVPPVDNGSILSYKATNVLIGLKKAPLDYLSLDYSLRYFKSNRDNDYDNINTDYWNYSFFATHGYEIELLHQLSALDNLDATIGLNYTSVEKNVYVDAYVPLSKDMNYIIETNAPVATSSVFTQLDYQACTSLKIVAGARLDHAASYKIYDRRYDPKTSGPDYPLVGTVTTLTSRSKSRNISNYRLASIYTMNDNNVFKFLYGEATRNHTGTNLSQNKKPDPEKTKTFEFNHIFTNTQTTVTSSLFWSSVENLMMAQRTFDPQQDGFITTRSFEGQSKTMGAELSILVQPIPNLTTEVSACFQETQDLDNKDIDFAYSPQLLGQLKIGYNSGVCSVSLTGSYVDSIETEWKPTGDGSSGQRIGDQTDDYFMLGANFRLADLYEGMYLNIRGSNLLNTQIRYPSIQSNAMLDKGTIGPGVACTITLGWEF